MKAAIKGFLKKVEDYVESLYRRNLVEVVFINSKVLFYYDIPMIMMAHNKDIGYALVMLLNDETLTYIAVSVSNEDKDELMRGAISTRMLFEKHNQKYFIGKYQGSDFIAVPYLDALTEDMLPAEGHYLYTAVKATI